MRPLAAVTSPTVFVVVLTWNGCADTLACLASLREVKGVSLHTIVVDNGSKDDTVAAVRRSNPEVEVIENGANLGFAEGNNVGIRMALRRGADWVLILNNDTVVAPDAITALLAAADQYEGAAVVTPLICFADPPDRVWYAGARFDPRRGHSGTMLCYGQPLSCVGDAPVPTDRAAGAAMLVARPAIEATGGFDEQLFFLYEDVDWSLRIRAAGWSILFVPQARIWHRVSASQGGAERTPTTSYYGLRNNLEVCRRHAPLRGWRAARREVACLVTHLWGLRTASHRGANARAMIAGWLDYHRGRMGPRRAAHAG